MSRPPSATDRPTPLSIVVAALLALVTVYLQYLRLFDAGSMQIERHVAVLRGEALDPWQYRLLSAWLVEGFLYAARALGLSRDPMTAMLLFRFLQNLAIFLLSGAFFRRLGYRRQTVLLGLGLLAWAMAFATYESDLSFNVYSGLVFYLLAALAVLDGRDAWLLLLAPAAALNRETALLMPFLLPAARWRAGERPPLDRRTVRMTLAACLLQAVVYLSTRALLGPRPPFHPHGVRWGADLLAHNLGRGLTWQYLLATFLAVPLVALLVWRRWPFPLRRWFWVVVPAWVAIHAVLAVLAETRLLLAPYVLVLLPAALSALDRRPVAARGAGVVCLVLLLPVLGGCGPAVERVRWVPIPGEASYAAAPYEMTATEITDGQYTLCVAAGACAPAGYPEGWEPWHRRSDLPVVRVDLERAGAFCAWLGGRLPTEPEWELAARGGLDHALYPWGDEPPTCEPRSTRGARFDDGEGCGARGPGPVGDFAANAFGLHDMAGNVWEWTAGGRVRGGSCFDPAPSLRIATRTALDPGTESANIGFRCVRVD